MRTLTVVSWLVCSCCVVRGQTPDSELTFEVASVKPAPPGSGGRGGGVGIRGGPGTADPGQITYTHILLKKILMDAYGMKDYQISGPDWLVTERYDIIAKIPEGTTKDQSNFMLRSLLKERFNLMYHSESRDLAVYELVVAKNGWKLNAAAAADDAPSAPGTPVRMTPDKDGFPDLPAGSANMVGVNSNGRMRVAARMQPISGLINELESMLDRHILDKTGLTGKYDFKLQFSTEGLGGNFARVMSAQAPPTATPVETQNHGGVSLFAAVQDQLGLKLESKKDRIDYLIIDHIDKVPTEN